MAHFPAETHFHILADLVSLIANSNGVLEWLRECIGSQVSRWHPPQDTRRTLSFCSASILAAISGLGAHLGAFE